MLKSLFNYDKNLYKNFSVISFDTIGQKSNTFVIFSCDAQVTLYIRFDSL